MKKLTAVLAAGCVASLMTGSIASAALTRIQVTANNGLSGITSTAYNNDSVLVIQGISAQSGWSGSWSATIVGGPNYGTVSPFQAFCTDLANQMPNGTYNYQAGLFSDAAYSPNPEIPGLPPDPNWATQGSGQKAAWVYNTYINQVGTDTTKRSAMALAIWEVLYEGSGTFDVTAKVTSGRSFAATGAGDKNTAGTAAYIANSWLAAGVVANWIGYNSTWWAEQDSTGYGDVQSLVGPVSAIPEPMTVIAGALLLLPVGVNLLRVLRKNRAA